MRQNSIVGERLRRANLAAERFFARSQRLRSAFNNQPAYDEEPISDAEDRAAYKLARSDPRLIETFHDTIAASHYPLPEGYLDREAIERLFALEREQER